LDRGKNSRFLSHVTNSLKGWKLGWIGIVVLEAFLETWIKFYYASMISSLFK
jgi:hypothetical protein